MLRCCIANVRAFVEAVATDHRLSKMLDKLREQGIPVDIKATGKFIGLVGEDVAREEADIMAASGFTTKEVSGPLSAKARQWFMGKLNESVGLPG